MSYYVHYTGNPPYAPTGVPAHMVAGPYSAAEVLTQKQDIQGYSGISDVYVDENPSSTTEKK